MKLMIGLSASHINFAKEKLKKLETTLHHEKFSYQNVPQEFLQIKLLNLNDVHSEELAHVEKKILEVSLRHHNLSLKLYGLSAFPNTQEARVLWIGVQNSIDLRALQEDTARALIAEKDLWEENVYKPILPVVRFKNHHNVIDLISPYKNTDFGKIAFGSLVLLEMTKSGAFPEFRLIRKFQLPKKDKPLDIAN